MVRSFQGRARHDRNSRPWASFLLYFRPSGGLMAVKSNQDATRLAALGDLRQCIALAGEIGNLQIVDGADPELELGALYELSLAEESPPLILFRNIKGYPPDYRVAVNVRSSRVFENGSG